MNSIFRIGICQMKVIDNKAENIKRAKEMIRAAAGNGAAVAVLPEMFNCPYSNSKFRAYSENIETGETIHAMSEIAKELEVYLAAGSIPEEADGKVYNTCFMFDKNGAIIGKHRKMHLFDIDIPGKITFRESDTLSAGDDITIVDTEFCRMGIAICYDIRFPEMMRLMALDGVKVIIVPAAFNMTTGPAHWEPLIKTRAVDNQVYMIAASPARDETAGYIAYGNSMVVGPWGQIIGRAGGEEEVVYADIDLMQVSKVRDELPLLKHRRTDIYSIYINRKNHLT